MGSARVGAYAALLLSAAAADDVILGPTKEPLVCKNIGALSSTMANCRYTIELPENDNKPQLVCVHNKPLSPQYVFGSLLRLFDVQTFKIHGEKLNINVDIHSGSEDTSLSAAFSKEPPIAQVRRAFTPEGASPLQSAVDTLRHALMALWHGRELGERRLSFSPFFTSCIGLRTSKLRALDKPFGASNVTVTVALYREGPLAGFKLSEALGNLVSGGGGGASNLQATQSPSPLRLWTGLAFFFAGLLLFSYSTSLAQSVSFHYAGGVTLSMTLGVLMIVLILWHRRGGGRRTGVGIVAASLLSLAGVTYNTVYNALWDLALSHWPWVVGYLAFFALLGYGLTYWRLKGGEPEKFECVLLARFMQLIGLVLISLASHSVSASASIVVVVLTTLGMPERIQAPVAKMIRKLTERKPAGKMYEYHDEDGKKRRWRPATRSGAYMSDEQYRQSGEIATEKAMKALRNTPEFARWVAQNHDRLTVAPVQRQPDFDDADDDADD